MSRKRNKSSNNTDYSDILDQIKDVEELPLVVTQVTYGRSGSGKTTYASTWPKPMLLLDIKDEGTDSIKDIEGIKVMSITEWDDFEKVYWYLKSGNHDFKSVAIDTVTMLQDKALESVLSEEGKEFPTQQVWGKASGLMKEWIMNYRDLADDGINIHFLAQDRVTESESEDDEQLDPEVGPRLMPSVAGSLTAAVKVVANTYVAETITRANAKITRNAEYRMRIGPHAFYTTKIRKPKSTVIPDYLVNPMFNDIISIMKGQTVSNDKKATAKKSSPKRRRTKK